MNQDMIAYYAQRAAVYERVYQKPERQADLKQIHEWLGKQVHDQRIIEIACGTGYWTQTMAEKARSVFATDINPEVLEIAQGKSYRCPVQFEARDLYQLVPFEPADILFGGFIWSHIPRQNLKSLISRLTQFIRPGGQIIFLDNRYVDGSSTPISHTDEFGNTYQDRKLPDGSLHRVMKNFPAEASIQTFLVPHFEQIDWTEWPYYWAITLAKPLA